MTNNKIKKMCELSAQIDALKEQLELLKAEAREEANGESVTFTYNKFTVIVGKGGKATETFDTVMFRNKAPKLYAECFEKYKKVGAPRMASVTAKIAK